jgi:hypothetical protein
MHFTLLSLEVLLRILATQQTKQTAPLSTANGIVTASMALPIHDGVLVPPAVYSTFNEVRGPANGGTVYCCNNAAVLH